MLRRLARPRAPNFRQRPQFHRLLSTTPLPNPCPQASDTPNNMSAPHLKPPKGTRDWHGADVVVRDQLFQTMRDVFTRHGGVALETPVFELKEILTGKYGEDAKLIYHLEPQGGEACSLRYDLTVPFARWLAMTGTTQIKRYSIAPVFRRDQPSITRGRLRQFHQCDFDIAGTYDPMIPDAQILRIVSECFDALKLDVTIKLNHRRILDGLFAVAGVPADKFRTISSAVDKLDKMSWEDVRKEMVEEKGLAGDVADAVGRAVQRSGTLQETTAALKSDLASASEPNPDIKAGLEDMELLAAYLKAYGVADRVEFDLSLARGLDYYTGLIYECIPKTGAKSPHESVGSIAAGGRYDNLVGMYGKTKIPCVGVSFGVDRIHTILKQRESNTATKMQVFVMAFGNKTFNGLMVERMEVTAELWNAGIRAETVPKVKSKLPQQFKAADAAGASIAVILGDDELAAGKVKVKVLGLPNDDPEKDGVLVDKTTLVDEVRKRLEQVRL